LRKHADVYVLDVSSGNGKWDEIFRLAGGRAGMTADAARVVDYLGPLYGGCWLHHVFVPFCGSVCAFLWLLFLVDRSAFFLPQLITTEEYCHVFITL
jgi:hypothetical protein